MLYDAFRELDMIRRVFLSHADADAPLAHLLRDEMRRCQPDLEVFISSQPGAIPTGTEWLGEVKRQLKSADAYVVLLTPASIQRLWIWFESGAAFASENKHVIGLCAPGMRKDNVPSPLGGHQLLTLESSDDCLQMFADLGLVLENASSFVSAARAVMERCTAAFLDATGWKGVALGDRYFAWDGPLDTLADWDKMSSPPDLVKSLNAAGVKTLFKPESHTGTLATDGYHPVFYTNRQTGKRLVIDAHGDPLFARPFRDSDQRLADLAVEWRCLVEELDRLSTPAGLSFGSEGSVVSLEDEHWWQGGRSATLRHQRGVVLTLNLFKADYIGISANKGNEHIVPVRECNFVVSPAGTNQWLVDLKRDSKSGETLFSGNVGELARWCIADVQRIAERQAMKEQRQQEELLERQHTLENQRAAQGCCSMCGMPMSARNRRAGVSQHERCNEFHWEARHSPNSFRGLIQDVGWFGWMIMGGFTVAVIAVVVGIGWVGWFVYQCRFQLLHATEHMKFTSENILQVAVWVIIALIVIAFRRAVTQQIPALCASVAVLGLLSFVAGIVGIATGRGAADNPLGFSSLSMAMAGAAIVLVFGLIAMVVSSIFEMRSFKAQSSRDHNEDSAR
jgi:hypothetical protein